MKAKTITKTELQKGIIKNNLKFIFILFFFTTTYFTCLGQTLTEQEYAELANLFAEDVQLMGDPMINFYHCMNDNCENIITLNGFDNSNPASHRYIVAKDKIIVNNYVIPSGIHVIFNAPEVDLSSGFECQFGGSFEIINEGCMSNCP